MHVKICFPEEDVIILSDAKIEPSSISKDLVRVSGKELVSEYRLESKFPKETSKVPFPRFSFWGLFKAYRQVKKPIIPKGWVLSGLSHDGFGLSREYRKTTSVKSTYLVNKNWIVED